MKYCAIWCWHRNRIRRSRSQIRMFLVLPSKIVYVSLGLLFDILCVACVCRIKSKNKTQMDLWPEHLFIHIGCALSAQRNKKESYHSYMSAYAVGNAQCTRMNRGQWNGIFTTSCLSFNPFFSFIFSWVCEARTLNQKYGRDDKKHTKKLANAYFKANSMKLVVALKNVPMCHLNTTSIGSALFGRNICSTSTPFSQNTISCRINTSCLCGFCWSIGLHFLLTSAIPTC